MREIAEAFAAQPPPYTADGGRKRTTVGATKWHGISSNFELRFAVLNRRTDRPIGNVLIGLSPYAPQMQYTRPMYTFYEVLRVLRDAHDNQIADITLVDIDALRLKPHVPRDGDLAAAAEALKAAVHATLAEADWFVSSIKNSHVLIEPRYTKEARWDKRLRRYHVALRSCRDRISKEGLLPHEGGTTQMARTYPSRVHLAVYLAAAFEFIASRCGDRHRAGGIPESMLTAEKYVERKQLDVWGVRIPEEATVYRDVLLPNRGGWTEDLIPPDQLKLVEDWHDLERKYRAIIHA